MRTLENSKQLVEMLKTVLVSWARTKDYKMPPTSWFIKYEFKFDNVKSFKSYYNGKPIEAVGTHDAGDCIIRIAIQRTIAEVYSTIIHELAHAVQFFNLGARFMELYNHEAKSNAHSKNSFEDEARLAATWFNLKITEDESYGKRVMAFEFKFKPLPKFKPIRYRCVDFDHYSTTREFKHNRNKWWLRR